VQCLDVLCVIAPLDSLAEQILLDNCFITSCSQIYRYVTLEGHTNLGRVVAYT